MKNRKVNTHLPRIWEGEKSWCQYDVWSQMKMMRLHQQNQCYPLRQHYLLCRAQEHPFPGAIRCVTWLVWNPNPPQIFSPDSRSVRVILRVMNDRNKQEIISRTWWTCGLHTDSLVSLLLSHELTSHSGCSNRQWDVTKMQGKTYC